jgi:hypothetical protein
MAQEAPARVKIPAVGARRGRTVLRRPARSRAAGGRSGTRTGSGSGARRLRRYLDCQGWRTATNDATKPAGACPLECGTVRITDPTIAGA